MRQGRSECYPDRMGKLEDTAIATTRIRRALIDAGFELVTDHPAEDMPANVILTRNRGADAGLSIIKVTVNVMTFMDTRREALAKSTGQPVVETPEPSAAALAEGNAMLDAIEAEAAAMEPAPPGATADPETTVAEESEEVHHPPAKRRRGRKE